MPPPYDPHRISITILGDGGVGKSALTLRLVKSQWTSDYDPTIEDSYTLTRRIDGTTYHLSITDTAGQEEYRGMWSGSNGGMKADAFLMVYDITRRESLEALGWFDELVGMEEEVRGEEMRRLMESSHANNKSRKAFGRGKWRDEKENTNERYECTNINAHIPPVKIIAGNKCDLAQSREVSASQGLEWARKRNCGFMETSARSIVNIEETFALIVRRVVEGRKRAETARSEQENAREGEWGRDGDESRLDGMEEGMGIGVDNGEEDERDEIDAEREKLGTRRAMTKPLTPLPPGSPGENEKMEHGNASARGGKRAKWREVGRKFICWR